MKLKIKGFSLIELMIVIAIIGILAAIAIPNYQNYVLKSKMGELLSGVSAAEMAVSEYIQSTGSADCSKMPIVLHSDGLFEYPDSTLIASITVDNNCNINAVGAADQWGTEDTPIVKATATLSRKGTSFVCSTNVSFTPSTCPQEFP